MNPPQSLTPISGTILNVYASRKANGKSPLGDLSIYTTNDGSISLYNTNYCENFHSSTGALSEAKEKFLSPAEIERFTAERTINILDVCFGMGYNIAQLVEALNKNLIAFNWWGLEIDPRPLRISLENPKFNSIWSSEVQKMLFSIQKDGRYTNNKSQGVVLWGDARQTLAQIPIAVSFDLILHDAFSPSKCPMLWTEEFLSRLTRKLIPGGRLITYSSAAAVRSSLRRNGMKVGSIIPSERNAQKWSNGTIAISPLGTSKGIAQNKNWKDLSPMEEDHLLTRAAVPYRDPSGNSSNYDILKQREKEQRNSFLEKTINWGRRWERRGRT